MCLSECVCVCVIPWVREPVLCVYLFLRMRVWVYTYIGSPTLSVTHTHHILYASHPIYMTSPPPYPPQSAPSRYFVSKSTEQSTLDDDVAPQLKFYCDVGHDTREEGREGVYVGVYVCMHVCLSVCMYVCIFAHIHMMCMT